MAQIARSAEVTRGDTLGQSSRTRAGVIAAAAAAGLAGSIHLALTPEHFEESTLFGAAFVVLGLYQVALSAWLILRPSGRAYQAGIWGSALIASTYIVTRVFPPPTVGAPEEVTGLGIAATSLELMALVLLVLALPERPGRRWPIPAWFAGLVTGLLTPSLWVFVTGAIQWTPPVAFAVPKNSTGTGLVVRSNNTLTL